MPPSATLRGLISRQAMAFVLAGGRGSRLLELTDRRAKPAVFFGGKTRIIDFALSNALNSGIRKMAIATQYKAHSLIRHCQRGWNFFRAERNEYLDILPASQRVDESKWYLGTADAEAEAAYAQRCAESLGWRYERIAGDPGLLRDLLSGNWDDGRFQVVAPGAKLRHATNERIFDVELSP